MFNNKLTFIAEIGMNHNGNFGLFSELIKQAAFSGADFAKFQLGWRDSPGEINALSLDDIGLIFKLCDFYNIQPLFSVITEDAFFRLRDNFDPVAYKIASRTVKDNPNLVELVLQTNKPVICSLGMWNSSALPFNHNNISYLWCKSLYPTLPWDLSGFPKEYNPSEVMGYSDHTVGIEASLIAIQRGASIIEKHFTLDKSDTSIRDHALSATPDEFSQLVSIGRSIHRLISLGV
jgi:N,N'-diacetyllegionaminate synthase